MKCFNTILGTCALFGLVVGVGSCKRPTKGTANPEDYFPLILVALDSGKTAAMISRNEYLDRKNFAGCVTAEALIAGLDATGEALAAKMADQAVIPALELDLVECLVVRDAESFERSENVVEAVAGIALSTGELYANKLKTVNCKKGTAVLGALAYLRGLAEPVAEQLVKPGSSISIPAVSISLSECK